MLCITITIYFQSLSEHGSKVQYSNPSFFLESDSIYNTHLEDYLTFHLISDVIGEESFN